MKRLEVSGAVRPLQWSLGVKRFVCLCLLYASQWVRLEYNSVVIGKVVREECVWVICVCISYTGDGGRRGSRWTSFQPNVFVYSTEINRLLVTNKGRLVCPKENDSQYHLTLISHYLYFLIQCYPNSEKKALLIWLVIPVVSL